MLRAVEGKSFAFGDLPDRTPSYQTEINLNASFIRCGHLYTPGQNL